MEPDPFDPSCERFARDMTEYDFFIMEDESSSQPTPEQRAEYVRNEEGTYNPQNGHFLCDRCYIKAGMPTSSTGWKCP